MNLSTHLTPTPTEPSTVKQALANPEWQQAMALQYKALIDNGTWEIVPPDSTQKSKLGWL